MQISLIVVKIELFFGSKLNPVFFPLKECTYFHHETNSGQLTLVLSFFESVSAKLIAKLLVLSYMQSAFIFLIAPLEYFFSNYDTWQN